MDKSIIFRIQKLLALANDGRGNEHEANLAMEKAHAIMSEHNLTMATIGATKEKGQEERAKEGYDGQAMFEYQRDLMNAIAETNYCYVSVIYSLKRRGRRAVGYQIIGTQSNVMTTRIMFEYLCNTIDRLVREFNNGDYRLRMSRSSISWCTGCANRLRDRIIERHENFLNEQKKKAEEERKASQHPASPSHGALVVVMEDYAQKEKDLNEDFRRGLEPGTTARRRAEYEAKAKARKTQKIAEAIAAGYDQKVANAYAEYYFDTLQEAYDWVYPKPQLPKSDKERAKEEARWEREERKANRREERRMNRKDWSAYAKGQDAGESIGLDTQIGKGSSTKAIK